MPDTPEREEQEAESNSNPAPVEPSTTPPCTTADHIADQCTHAPTHEHHAAKHRTWNTLLQVGLLIIGAAYSFFAYQQWQVIRGQLEIGHLDQRAWIAPIAFDGTPQANQVLEVRVRYKNTGKTYARDVRPVFFAYRVQKGAKPDFGIVENTALNGDGAKFLLPPNGESTSYHRINNGKPLSAEDFRQIESGEMVVFAFGKIYYADIFGCKHWIKFSTFLDWEVKGYAAYNEYDDADNNCGPSIMP